VQKISWIVFPSIHLQGGPVKYRTQHTGCSGISWTVKQIDTRQLCTAFTRATRTPQCYQFYLFQKFNFLLWVPCQCGVVEICILLIASYFYHCCSCYKNQFQLSPNGSLLRIWPNLDNSREEGHLNENWMFVCDCCQNACLWMMIISSWCVRLAWNWCWLSNTRPVHAANTAASQGSNLPSCLFCVFCFLLQFDYDLLKADVNCIRGQSVTI